MAEDNSDEPAALQHRRRDGDGPVAGHRPGPGRRVRLRHRPDGARRRLPIGNETPNIVYELLLGGVLSATLVPLFTSFDERDDEESTNVVITTTLVALAVLTVVAVVAAPLIFGLYTLDRRRTASTPTQFREVGTLLTRIFLLQIFFYGATGLANALLNSRRRFFAAAWSPILANVIIIATPAVAARRPAASSGRSPTCSTTTGCAGRSGSAPPPASRRWRSCCPGRPPRRHALPARRCDLRHPAVRSCSPLSGWTLGYVVANQVSIVVVRNLADPGSGDAAAYFDAFTFFVLPHGLLAMSIATTFVPGDGPLGRPAAIARAFSDQASLGLRLIALLTLPAGVLHVRAPPGDRRRLPAARRVHRGRRRQHVPGPRRLRPRPRRLLGVPVRAPRLLRPPGHAHAVRHQRRAERRSTSCWRSSSSAATACSASALALRRSPTSSARCGRCRCCRTRCRASRCATSWPACGGWSSPARSPAR